MIEALAAATGLNASALRLLVSLIICYPIAYLYRQLPASPPTNKQDPNAFPFVLKHIFSAASGMFLAYFNYGNDIIHSFLSILITYFVLLIIPDRKLSTIIVFFGAMGHLLTCYFFVSTDGYDIDFTTAQCVLALRLISLGFDYWDGSKPDAQSDQKVNGLKQLPNLLEVYGFCYFFGGFLTGPQFTFRRYQDFVTLKLFKKPKSDEIPKEMPPIAVGYILRCVGIAVLYLGLNVVGDMYFPADLIIDPSFVTKHGFWYRMFYITVCMKFILWRYLGVWLLAEGSCVLAGIGFREYSSDGSLSWNGLSNVNPYLYETTPTLNGIIESFNINTNDWTKRYIFKRLIFLNNKTISSFGALLFLAIWHGFAIGYFMCFFLEFLDMQVETRFKALGLWERIELRVPGSGPFLFVVAWMVRNFCLSYGLLAFIFKTWTHSLMAYQSVYYINHIAVVLLLVIHPIIAPMFKTKKNE